MNKIDFNFDKRTAVITGGAQGFGLDIAKKFLDFAGIGSVSFRFEKFVTWVLGMAVFEQRETG